MWANDELMASFEEGQVDYEESHTGSPHREGQSPNRRGDERSAQESRAPLRTPNPFPDRPLGLAELRELAEPRYSPLRGRGGPSQGAVGSNDLDEAQAEHVTGQMNLPPRSQRPELRPLLTTGRADYTFQPRDPVEAARQAATQNLTLYVIGPPARTPDEVALRTSLRERLLTPQATTVAEYRERLRRQGLRQSCAADTDVHRSAQPERGPHGVRISVRALG
ncbi:uncharacterized protein IUM83_02003 [Phytophthora cinnamomi]|uniref:uncharacterized protein n=1 Tax=Phytophthora cinnamomi TaxID=4785 RepID=UPI0035596D7A|nr:hypothetical protein IUM83_02003 [Phytophthora cinnamomi]